VASDDPRRGDPAENRQLRQLRLAAGGLILAAILFLVVGDTLGRLLVNPNFHIDDVALGVLVGALLSLVFGETIVRLRR